MGNGSKVAIFVGFILSMIGLVWTVSNMMGASNEVNEANRELEESNHAVDAALIDCLKFSTYYDCQNVVMNNCLEDGKGHDECLTKWNEVYGRAIGA